MAHQSQSAWTGMKAWGVAAALLAATAMAACSAEVAHAQSASSQIINRIEIVGSNSLPQAEIENSIELSVDTRVERRKVEKTIQNLRELYEMKGYEEVQVTSDFFRDKDASGKFENVVRFVVTEGLPTRISEIRLKPARTSYENFKQYWSRMASSLQASFGMKAGDILEKEQIAVGRRAIQEALASDEYVGAEVSDARILESKAPAGDNTATARWVALELEVDLGDHVTFGYRGNTVFSYGELSLFIDEQRLIGFGKDYIGAIRSRIIDEYKNLGFAEVSVAVYTFEREQGKEKHVTYEIKEGPRFRIESIQFDGNFVFSSKQLEEEFYARSIRAVQQGYYVDKEIDRSAELLVEWIKSQGYLAAKVVTVNRIAIPKMNRYKLLIYLYEGDQTVIQNIHIEGARALSIDDVKKHLMIQENAPLNLFAFNEGLEFLKSVYRSKGHLEARILNEGTDTVVQYSQENRVADIFIKLDEGYQYRASRIEIEGLTKTREEVVRRELKFGSGDVLEEQRINESEASVRRLGIFAAVSLRLTDDPEKNGYKIVRVSVQEGTPGLVAGGVGYRNDLGIRVFGQTAYSNLWRRNHTLSLSADVNRRFDEEFCSNEDAGARGAEKRGNCFLEYSARLGYIWPWFIFGDTTFRPVLSFDKTQYISFDAATTSLTAALERQLLPSPNLTATLTYGLEYTRQFNGRFDVDNQTLTIGSLIPSLRLDMRDNSLAPTSGFFASASYEYASTAFGSQKDPFPIGYSRALARVDGFIPVARGVTWYLSFRIGHERNNEPPPANDPNNRNYAIPLIKQFALGGAGSLRGFQEQELNVQDLAIRGTASYVNYRTQIDLPFAGPLRFGPFLDAANLLVDEFSFGRLRYGAGVGFHYLSPVGPVNFDWGFKIDPQPEEDPHRFYFSIGVI